MNRKIVSDYSDDELAPLGEAKAELVNNAHRHGVRSVRHTVNERYDVPALRIESKHDSLYNSARDVIDHHELTILTAFVTKHHTLTVIAGQPDGGR